MTNPDVHLDRSNAKRLLPRLILTAFGVGALSGFFGIGGGLLIVPGLIAATAMPILNAVGSSLVAVTTFGLTTTSNYALAGLVDWSLALQFIAGGVIGTSAAGRLGKRKHSLTRIFSAVVICAGVYVVAKGTTTFI